MTGPLPPELLTPEERAARVAELRRAIGREWLRYVVVEMVLFGVPLIVALVLWRGTGTISDGDFIAFVLVAGLGLAVLALYTLRRRIAPLQGQIEAIEAVGIAE